MKVIVLYENTREQSLANNLVKVLKAIGAMLVYGKVEPTGVRLEDWQSKPRVNIECVAGPAPAMTKTLGPVVPKPFGSYTADFEYREGIGYVGPALQPPSATLTVTREFARDMVKMFPESTEAKRRAVKPVVPKPDTTETGVTVRELDMWEDEDDQLDRDIHGDPTD